MKIAAIDLGSNSFHLIIAELLPDMSFRTIESVKDMIQLGKSIGSKKLDEQTMQEGINAILRFKKIAILREVESFHIIAFATSAIRESSNGGEYIERIQRETGVNAKVISGVEEGRLVYLAMKQAIDIENKKALMIDVGGGSTEFVLGSAEQIFMIESKKLGIIRLYEMFVSSDPISKTDIMKLEQHIENELQAVYREIKKTGFDMAIACAGTIANIAKIILGSQGDDEIPSLNGYVVLYDYVDSLYNKVIKMDLKERRKLKGIDTKRSEFIAVGLLLYKKMFEIFQCRNIAISEYGLREGMVVDYFQNHLQEFRLANMVGNVRKRSVLELAYRCQWDEPRSRYIAILSMMLFDELKNLHKLSEKEKELLEYASYLHNIGCIISSGAHHKHSFYIISNASMHGFSPEEISIIANVSRYHRKSLPKESHPFYEKLSKQDKQNVCILAGILRIANSLDRTHREVVKQIKVKEIGGEIVISILTSSDSEIEIWAANLMKDLLEISLEKKIRFAML